MGIFDKKHGGEKVDETADLPAYERDHSLDVEDGLFENAGMRRCRGRWLYRTFADTAFC